MPLACIVGVDDASLAGWLKGLDVPPEGCVTEAPPTAHDTVQCWPPHLNSRLFALNSRGPVTGGPICEGGTRQAVGTS